MPRTKRAPAAKPSWRLYRCRRYTNLRLGNVIRFENKAYATDDPVEIDIIESSADFKGGEIYKVEDATEP